ncbi:MAG: AI-2E family transporter [Thermoanaerobaculia bacterium]
MSDPVEKAAEGWGRTLPLLRGAAIFVILGGLKAADSVLLPLLLASFLAGLSIPVLDALRRRGMGRVLAVGLTYLGLVALLVAVGFLLGQAVSGFLEEVPTYLGLLLGRYEQAVAWLDGRGITLADWWSPQQLDASYLVDKVSGLVGGAVRGVWDAFSFLLLALVALLFLLVEATEFDVRLARALGDRREVIAGFVAVSRNIQRYLLIKTATSAMVGVLAGLLTWLAGVDFPLIWGMLAFFLHYIPVIGAIVAGVPPVLLALALLGPGRAALLALGFLVINFVVGNLLEPLLMGRPLGLSPLAVLMSLAFWGWVWGVIGMVLSVPLTLVIKSLLDRSGQLRWLAVLLGPAPETATSGAEPAEASS